MRQKLLISASALLLASAAGQAEALDLGVNSNTRAKTSVSTPAARANVDLGADVGLEGRSRARFERGYEDDDYDNVRSPAEERARAERRRASQAAEVERQRAYESSRGYRTEGRSNTDADIGARIRQDSSIRLDGATGYNR